MFFLLIFVGFKSNKTELNAVFDIFDRGNRDFIEYQEFIEAMKPKRHVSENSNVMIPHILVAIWVKLRTYSIPVSSEKMV